MWRHVNSNSSELAGGGNSSFKPWKYTNAPTAYFCFFSHMQSFRFCIQIHADRDANKNLSGWLEHFHPVMENGVQSGVDPNPLRKCVHQSKQKEVYTAAQQIAVYVGATSWGCIGALIFQCTIRWVTFFHMLNEKQTKWLCCCCYLRVTDQWYGDSLSLESWEGLLLNLNSVSVDWNTLANKKESESFLITKSIVFIAKELTAS